MEVVSERPPRAIFSQPMTLEEFERISLLPENADRLLEYIAGSLVELTPNSVSSEIAASIGAVIIGFVRVHRLGRVTDADGGYWMADERYMPNVAFISNARQPERPNVAWNPVAPDLAIEVLSSGNTNEQIGWKIVHYLRAGTLLWVVHPKRQVVEVYAPGQRPQRFGIDDILTGGDVLPGFTLPVRDIFTL